MILEDAKAFQAKDQAKIPATLEHRINRSWVDTTLEEKEFEIIDDVYRP